MRISGILLALAFSTASARADDDPPAPPKPEHKSEDTAFWLSAGSTAAAAGMIGLGLAMSYGFSPTADNPPRLLKVPLHNWGNGIADAGAFALLFTPSIGHWYAHEIWTRGMTIRALGFVALAGAGVAGLANACFDPADFDCPPPNEGAQEAEVAFEILAAALFTAGAIDDVATARSAAGEYNRTHARSTIMPLVQAHAVGLGIAGAF